MKKLISLLLVLTMLLSFAACGSTETPAEGENTEVTVGSALEILETVWGKFGEDEKFFAMGGDYDNMVDNAPGAVTNAEIASALEKQGVKLDKRKIVLNETIKNVGTYTATCKLGYEITAPLTVKIEEL